MYGAVGIGPVNPTEGRVREPALVAQVASVGSVQVTCVLLLFPLVTSNSRFRTRANASMWASGLGVIETSSRILKGSDVLVVVLNESAAELDFESSAFISESREDTDVDITVR